MNFVDSHNASLHAEVHSCLFYGPNPHLERFPPDVNRFVPKGIPELQQIRFGPRNH